MGCLEGDAKAIIAMLGTLVKVLKILELFTVHHPKWGITEISKKLKLNKSSVFRILQTLEDRGYVRQDPVDRGYMLTAKFLGLGTVIASQMDIFIQSKDGIDYLWKKTQGTISLRVLEGSELITVAIRESPQALRVSHQVGSRVNFNWGSIGKAILAYLPEQRVKEFLKRHPLKRFTSKTVLSTGAFLGELEHVRKNGFALSDEEALQGVRSVGAPIFNIPGIAFAGISIGLPVFRFPKAKVGELGRLVRQTADRISKNLGYNGPLIATVKIKKKATPVKGRR